MTSRELAEAVRDRRRQLGLPQSLEAWGGPVAATIRAIEHDRAGHLRQATHAGLERALAWPRGYVHRLLVGTAEDLGDAPVARAPRRDTPVALAGRLVAALVDVPRTPAAETVLTSLERWMPELAVSTFSLRTGADRH